MDRKIDILVVDDFAVMRRIIRKLLGDIGFAQVTEADGTENALSHLHAAPCDLLITDWNMRGRSGLDLLRAVRADERLGGLPVLMVTAEAQREQIVEAARSGVSGYIAKPFTAAILEATIERIFSGGSTPAVTGPGQSEVDELLSEHGL